MSPSSAEPRPQPRPLLCHFAQILVEEPPLSRPLKPGSYCGILARPRRIVTNRGDIFGRGSNTVVLAL